MGNVIRKNEKGFTLIELLAVIVIMGVLMIVAIPAVTKYIERSKMDAYADTAKAYINSARYSILNDEYSCALPASGASVYIPISQIDIDQGGTKSPYNRDIVGIDIAAANLNAGVNTSYVKVTGSGGTNASTDGKMKYSYSIAMTDSSNNGLKNNGSYVVSENKLDRNAVLKGQVAASNLALPSGAVICKKN